MKKKTSSTYVFNISLSHTSPLVWRKVEINGESDFYLFHLSLQAAFGWLNYHLFEFTTPASNPARIIGLPHDDTEATDARSVSLKQVFKKKGDTARYVYDFGDYWQHEIVLESISNTEIFRPGCLSGENECPPEDCGGIPGYLDLLEVFKSGKATERKALTKWIGLPAGENWNEKYFNQREVNKRMALVMPDVYTVDSLNYM